MPCNLSDLYKEIITAINGESTLMNLHRKVYSSRGVHTATRPYCVFDLVNTKAVGYFGRSYTEHVYLQFNVYSNVQDQANSYADVLKKFLLGKRYPAVGCIATYYVSQGIRMVGEVSEESKPVYQSWFVLELVVDDLSAHT